MACVIVRELSDRPIFLEIASPDALLRDYPHAVVLEYTHDHFSYGLRHYAQQPVSSVARTRAAKAGVKIAANPTFHAEP